MGQIRRADLAQVAKREGLKLHNQIKAGQFKAVEETMNLICRTITNTDEFINDEFISSVVKEVYGEYGGDQLVASERGYPIDYKPGEKTKMKVTTACGDTIEIDSVKCCASYSAEVFNQYFDYLTVNKQKTLPVAITQNELRRISCGEDTYNQLRQMILAKVTESIEAYIRDEVYCLINDPRNYKKITEITYTCDECDGTSFIQALTEWVLKLQITAKDYNLAGRVYDLPLKTKAWLLNSIGLSARLASRYARGGTNASYIDISSKFLRTYDIPQLTIADGIVMDTNWIQVRKIFDELVWEYKPALRNECGVYNLDLKIKPINFFVAAPFKLIEISKDDKQAADDLTDKIETIVKEYTIADQPDAETQIKADIDAFNTSGKLNIEYTFTNFNAPTSTETADGSIKVSVAISNKNGNLIETANNILKLKKK